MVTRGIGAQQAAHEVGAFRNTVTGSILPVLGLSAALGVLTGGFNDATASGRMASSTMYGVQTSLYGVQDAVARALLPLLEELAPLLEDGVNGFLDLDEATDGWATKIALGSAGALAFRRQLLGIIRLAARLPVGGALGGTAGAAAGAAAGSAAGAATVAAGGVAAAGLGALTVDQLTGNFRVGEGIVGAVLGDLDYTLSNAIRGAFGKEPIERPADGQPGQPGQPGVTRTDVFFQPMPVPGLGSPTMAQNAPQTPIQAPQGASAPMGAQTVNNTYNVSVDAPGLYDTEGLTRQLRTLMAQGLVEP